MPAINTTTPIVSAHPFNTAALELAPPADRLAHINALYPNLDSDLVKAEKAVESTRGTGTWAGLNWYEKAVFFLPPVGPFLGMAILSNNHEVHENAVSALDELKEIAQLRSDLEKEVATNRPDRPGVFPTVKTAVYWKKRRDQSAGYFLTVKTDAYQRSFLPQNPLSFLMA